jgi:hypothetical protein
MPDITRGNRRHEKQNIPRIESKEAARIFAQLENLLDSAGDSLGHLRRAGFTRLLSQLDEKILELAVQPDSWGERTRARLVSEIFTGLRGIPAEDASVQEIVRVSNVVMPCLLLELGRRRQHIQIEFPNDPCVSAARFRLRAGPSRSVYSINSEQLIRLVAEAGEELVGLCYFGDQQSRKNIETQLGLKGATNDSSG